MKHSKILKSIRKDIAMGDREHICLGLMWFEDTPSEANANEIAARIDEGMGKCAGLGVDQWLFEVGIPEEELTYDNLRFYRLRWLDELIAEYEEMGK